MAELGGGGGGGAQKPFMKSVITESELRPSSSHSTGGSNASESNTSFPRSQQTVIHVTTVLTGLAPPVMSSSYVPSMNPSAVNAVSVSSTGAPLYGYPPPLLPSSTPMSTFMTPNATPPLPDMQPMDPNYYAAYGYYQQHQGGYVQPLPPPPPAPQYYSTQPPPPLPPVPPPPPPLPPLPSSIYPDQSQFSGDASTQQQWLAYQQQFQQVNYPTSF